MQNEQLTAAVWTPRGRGAVATIRISGSWSVAAIRLQPLLHLAKPSELSNLSVGRIRFARWGRAISEDIVVCLIGESDCEIHCHGGNSAVERILDDLEQVGFHLVEWQEQLTSSAQSDDRNEFDAELTEALTRAVSLRAAAWIVDQEGRMARAIREIEQLLADRKSDMARSRIDEILAWSAFGLSLSRPWSVVLGGSPNVGKSSLINAIVGFDRSIVFDEPGTTRDVVSVETILDGWAIRLSDTAGQRSSADSLEADGIQRANRALSSSDLPIIVLDLSRPPQPDDLRLLADWPKALVVGNKRDLPDQWGQQFPHDGIRVSALQKAGLSELTDRIIQRLVPAMPPDGSTIPIAESHVARLRQLHSDS